MRRTRLVLDLNIDPATHHISEWKYEIPILEDEDRSSPHNEDLPPPLLDFSLEIKREIEIDDGAESAPDASVADAGKSPDRPIRSSTRKRSSPISYNENTKIKKEKKSPIRKQKKKHEEDNNDDDEDLALAIRLSKQEHSMQSEPEVINLVDDEDEDNEDEDVKNVEEIVKDESEEESESDNNEDNEIIRSSTRKSKGKSVGVFGKIPGIAIGTCWERRVDCAKDGIHRPWVAGIHGTEREGCYSIALSGGYEDDVDYGKAFTYTGSGGRDLKGTAENPKNLRTAGQSRDQELTKGNKALQVSWETQKPIRVIRGFKLKSRFAPKTGYRYDGLYVVEKVWQAKGVEGFLVWRFQLKYCDGQTAPWEMGRSMEPSPRIYPELKTYGTSVNRKRSRRNKSREVHDSESEEESEEEDSDEQ